MLQMKRACPENRADILHLWQAEFGDGEALIDEFCAWCGWEQIFLLWEDGQPAAMTAAPLMELALPDGERVKAGYIYAFTTRKDCRRKGFGSMLLNYADFCLQNQDAHCAVLVPAEESLFRYFARSGYQQGFAVCEKTVDVPSAAGEGGRLCPADPERYRTIREERLANLPHVVSPLALLEQQQSLCTACSGSLYALELPSGMGCAVSERREDAGVFLRELLLPEGEERNALALLAAHFGVSRLSFRCPAVPDAKGVRPFGMVKWYRAESAEKWGKLEHGYMGLALD